MLNALGWVGSMLFCFCALPQAIQSYRDQHGNGLTWGFLMMWFFGEILTLVYVLITGIINGNIQYPLIANYSLNFIILVYIIYIKLWGKNVNRRSDLS